MVTLHVFLLHLQSQFHEPRGNFFYIVVSYILASTRDFAILHHQNLGQREIKKYRW